MASLLEEIARRAQMLPPALAFPDWFPPAVAPDDEARLPRLSDLPQTLLPPHLRTRAGAVDASSPAIQSAIGNIPAGPAIPPQMAVHPPGMLPLDQANSQFTTPEGRAMMADVGVDAPVAPMPRARPDAAPPPIYPDDGSLPAGAPPVAGNTEVGARSRTVGAPMQIAPEAPAAAPGLAPPEVGMFGGASSILDRIRNTLGDNSNTLLAIGAGFAGAPNLGQGISRAAAAAIPARAADINQTLARQSRGVTTQALMDAGVPRQQAIAAQTDPELKKALIQSYISDRKSEIKTVKSKDMFGNETERMFSVNPYTNESKEITPGGAAGKGGGAPAGVGNKTFAPGVTMETFDPSKSGDEYLSQFSPEVQSGVKAYLRGDSLPVKSVSQQAIKMVAQKYGEDMGIPANDQDYVARKNFKASLGDIKSGVGLAVKGFQQGTSHLASAAEEMVKLGNMNAGLTDVGNVINNLKNRTAKQGGIAASVDAQAQALAGEVGKLYSGSNGGGVHEREATKKLFGNPNATAEQQAGALEATLHLMEGGLTTIENRKRALFRDQEIPGGNFIGAEEQRNIERVKNAIKVLRGEAKAATTAPAVAAPAPGTYVWDAASGKLVPAK